MMVVIEDKSNLVTIHTRRVDPTLRREFKSYCARKRMSMQAAVIALMELAIDSDLEFNLDLKFGAKGGE